MRQKPAVPPPPYRPMIKPGQPRFPHVCQQKPPVLALQRSTGSRGPGPVLPPPAYRPKAPIVAAPPVFSAKPSGSASSSVSFPKRKVPRHSDVVQGKVTRSELKKFFAGRKPGPFVENVRGAVARIGDAISTHFPDFDYDDDYDRVEAYARKLVGYLADKGNTLKYGLPPSQRTKVHSSAVYLGAKNQT